MNRRIGFIQGRLSPMVDGKIQAFPKNSWRDEFALAEAGGFCLMEWTLDQEGLYQNPLMTEGGQREIRELCSRHGLVIPSLTGDCFMQAPFWKSTGEEKKRREQDFLAVSSACAAVGISMIVVPLVDNGGLENTEQEDCLVEFLEKHVTFFESIRLQVTFESDFPSAQLARFIARLDSRFFGINYDIGNSAALGFSAEDEIAQYGDRIINIHVKDRLLAGTTVPLGTGNADFEKVFSLFATLGYKGNYILQTARAENDDHAGVLCRYRDMVNDWMTI